MQGDMYLLKNYENKYGENPLDKFAIIRTGTLAAGVLTVNLKGIIAGGSSISYCILKQATTNTTTKTLTVASAALAGTETVNVLILSDVRDQAPVDDVI